MAAKLRSPPWPLIAISFCSRLLSSPVSRRDLSISQKEREELKLSLRKKEKQVADALRADSGPRVEGLCLKCAQHEAVLERTHTNLHAKAVERLAK